MCPICLTIGIITFSGIVYTVVLNNKSKNKIKQVDIQKSLEKLEHGNG